jgi:hypothetical protein
MIRSWIGKAAATAALSFAAVATTSTAAQAQNTISFQGTANISPQNPVPGGSLVGAPNLLIDFLSGQPQTVAGPPTGTFDVGAGRTGIFNIPGITTGMAATVSDILISGLTTPISTTTLNSPNAFLTVGGYTFLATSFPNQNATLPNQSFGPILLRENAAGTIAELSVFGTVTGNGLVSPTNYRGVLSVTFAGVTPTELFNIVNNGTSYNGKTVSSDFSVSLVPEPSTYALMAAGLAGIALVARRRRTA